MSTTDWMNKEDVVCRWNGILFSLKEEEKSSICNKNNAPFR